MEEDRDCRVEGCAYGEEGYVVSEGAELVLKMDSGCSRCMSGAEGRILVRGADFDVSKVIINGFNKSTSRVDDVGQNEDGKLEYFVSSMPANLVLLCAHDYARDGAVVLFGDCGFVYKLTDAEQRKLRVFVGQYQPWKTLAVHNRTYDVIETHQPALSALSAEDRGPASATDTDEAMHESGPESAAVITEAVNSVANTYFNTKVNVSNAEERILVYLISGLSIKDMFKYVKYRNLSGLHPDVTVSALNSFKHKWGTTPDAFQLAHPNREGNRKGYMAERVAPTKCGEYVEMDYMECDFNEESPVTSSPPPSLEQQNGLRKRKKAQKLATHGGAIAANLWVDAYSGYIGGELVSTTAKPIGIVRRCVQMFQLYGHRVQVFAADSGVSSQSMFQVFTPEVDEYLLSEKIVSVRSEPYNHSNGTPRVENVIKPIMTRIRMATQYILRNPNFHQLGFTEEHVLRLWGELFNWAKLTLNLTESSNVPGKTKQEVFLGQVPNIQEIRLLPIFAILMVYRPVRTSTAVGKSNRPFFQYGLYVGPDLKVSGGVRIALLTNGKLQIVVTTKYKGVSDGGGINVYPQVARGVQNLLADQAGVPAPAGVPDAIPFIEAVVDDPDVEVEVTQSEHEAAASPGASSPLRGEYPPGVSLDVEDDGQDRAVWSKQQQKKAVRKAKRQQRRVVDQSKWPTREERMRQREQSGAAIQEGENVDVHVQQLAKDVEQCAEYAMFTDWSNHSDGAVFYSFADHGYYVVSNATKVDSENFVEVGYKVVTAGVPKNFTAALKDSTWGDPSRAEWNNLMDMKTLVQVERHIADADIRKGADVVVLFPIYEEKVKEGVEVKKVRLVCNGRTQYHAGATYAPTPSREEFYVLMHMCAKYDWDYCHVDEVRAFLNAPYQGETPVYARMRGDPNYYKILGALYGLRTSPRHYSDSAGRRLVEKLSCTRLHMCSCIYVRRYEDGVVFIYVFVDDYVAFGNVSCVLKRFIDELISVVKTTPPSYNATSILGMTITRDWDKHTISISLANKVAELGEMLGMANRVKKEVPLPASGYIVNDSAFDAMSDKRCAEYVDDDEITLYMQIVGSLIWISGARFDINFGVMYLTWFTKNPRVHHLTMAYYLASYLYYSKDVPLVLGGTGELVIETFFDASWGTGPKGRSISAVMVRLGEGSGCIVAKCTASASTVSMSSFEAELDCCTVAVKTTRRVKNIFDELQIKPVKLPHMYNDNLAMINFVKGEGTVKGARHMELRMWYVREMYSMGEFVLLHMEGIKLPPDRLTKSSTKEQQRVLVVFVMGINLL